MARRLGLLVVIFSLGLAVVGCRRNFLPSAKINPTDQSVEKINQTDLETRYEAVVKEILAPYWQTANPSGLKDQLLSLTVPTKYLQLHLELVLGLEMLESGLETSAEAKIARGKQKIADSAEQSPWLK